MARCGIMRGQYDFVSREWGEGRQSLIIQTLLDGGGRTDGRTDRRARVKQNAQELLS